MATQTWLAPLVASGMMSSDAENNSPGRRNGAPYTRSAVEHPRSSSREARVPSIRPVYGVVMCIQGRLQWVGEPLHLTIRCWMVSGDSHMISAQELSACEI